jgi:hypothetical protein
VRNSNYPAEIIDKKRRARKSLMLSSARELCTPTEKIALSDYQKLFENLTSRSWGMAPSCLSIQNKTERHKSSNGSGGGGSSKQVPP